MRFEVPHGYAVLRQGRVLHPGTITNYPVLKEGIPMSASPVIDLSNVRRVAFSQDSKSLIYGERFISAIERPFQGGK